jgi:hypothetical protein
VVLAAQSLHPCGGGMDGTTWTFPSIPEPEVPAGGMTLKLATTAGEG